MPEMLNKNNLHGRLQESYYIKKKKKTHQAMSIIVKILVTLIYVNSPEPQEIYTGEETQHTKCSQKFHIQ